jgi:putative membrane-bound dehydrogenase-like protein
MIRSLCCCLTLFLLSVPVCPADDETGFKPIFDGESLTGWDGEEGYWRVEEGAIVGESTDEKPLDHNTFLVWDQGEVDDFELRLQFRISGTERANSGIQFRSRIREDGHVIGYQADFDRSGRWVGALYDEGLRAILATRGQKTVIDEEGEKQTEQVADANELMQAVDLDDWNDYTVTARGNHIVLKINDRVMAEVIDNDREGLDRIGVLALQLHSGPPMKVEFKNIRLKRFPLEEGWKKAVFVAGSRSHGYFAHEHNAGSLLLADRINAAQKEHGLPVIATVYTDGWPQDPTALDNADTLVAYCDGGGRHFFNDRLEEIDHLVNERGLGIVCIHYAVEPPANEEVYPYFLNWLGGYFEIHWSVNPHWDAEFKELPEHPITVGVQPFTIRDEWYYHMRFVEGMEGVTPILTALPPRESLNRPDGHHSGNPHVREAVLERKEPQHVAWAYERPDGKGRGFGFTGGHFHQNWQHDDFRKVVLNAIVWSTGLEVPEEGVPSKTPTQEELEQNQDFPKPEEKKTSELGSGARDQGSGVRGQGAGFRIQDSDRGTENRKLKTENFIPVAFYDDQPVSHDPADAIAQLDVHEDLEVTLFASEPTLTNPASLDIDHLGRVWVCEAVNYRAFRNADVIGENPEPDRILILEDTTGDGKADTTHVFHQGRDVDSAHGILILPTPDGKGLRALVSAGDSVFFLIDETGDLKADRKEVLFTGIDGVQHDHGIHAFHFGPDGKLYFNFGNVGKRIKDREGNPIIDKAGNEVNDSRNPYQEGMVFRCNLDGSEFETIAWNFRNNWELCVDSFGTIWQSDNDDDGNRGCRINYVMEFGNYGYKDELTGAGWRTPRTGWAEDVPTRHWHQNDPGVIPNLLQTGAGSPTGICIYEGDLLPEVFHGAVLHCDAGPNVCRAYVTKPDSAGYSAEIVNILDGSRHKWFRPSDVCVAPDGSLFVADWYDAGVGGHRMQNPDRGRIFRVVPKGQGLTEKYVVPKTDVSTVEGAIDALKSSNMTTRYLGWTALMEMGEDAEPALVELWNSDNPRFRARALWLLGKLDLPKEKTVRHLRAGLTDSNPDLRITAIRLLRQVLDRISYDEIAGAVDVSDPSAAVRREMLIGLRDVDPHWYPDRDMPVQVWASLAVQHDGEDRWYLEALGIAADGRWDDSLLTLEGEVASGWMKSKPGRDIIWRSRSSDTPDLLAEIIADPNTPTEEIPRSLRAFDFQEDGSKNAALTQLAFQTETGDAGRDAFVRAEALNRLDAFDAEEKPEYLTVLNQVLEASRGSEQFVRLVGKFNVTEKYADLLRTAQQQPDSQVAVEAIKTLAGKRQLDLIQEALWSDDRETVERTLSALATAADGRTNPPLLELVNDAERPMWARRGAVKSLGTTLPGARTLLEIAEGGEYAPQLRDSLAATLTTAQWRVVREPAEQLFPPPPGKDTEPVPPISELIERKGDVANGRVVFNTTGTCNKCHQVNGIGTEIGPDLSEVGKKLTKPALFEAVLYPSASISHNYESWLIVTVEGLVHTGLIVSETDTRLQLKDEKGIVRTIPVVSIEERHKQDVSLMPGDIQKLMTTQELVDVVEYMTTLKERRR